MAKVSDKELTSEGQKIIVYGPPKSGKTKAVGELAEAGYNLYWFDLEHGAVTLKQLSHEAQKRIELIKVPDNKSNYLAVRVLLSLVKGPITICDEHGMIGKVCADCMKISKGMQKGIEGNLLTIDIKQMTSNDIIVVDSLTQISASALALATKDEDFTKHIKFEWDHWGAQGFYLDTILGFMQQSPNHWVFISHEGEVEMTDGKDKIVPVAGTRNFSRNTGRYFDHVVYCSLGNYKYKKSSNGLDDMSIVAGSRLDIKLSDTASELVQFFQNPDSVKKVKQNSSKDEVATKKADSEVVADGSTTSEDKKNSAGLSAAQQKIAALKKRKLNGG